MGTSAATSAVAALSLPRLLPISSFSSFHKNVIPFSLRRRLLLLEATRRTKSPPFCPCGPLLTISSSSPTLAFLCASSYSSSSSSLHFENHDQSNFNSNSSSHDSHEDVVDVDGFETEEQEEEASLQQHQQEEEEESEAHQKQSVLPRLECPKLSVKEKKELSSYAHRLGKKLKSQQVGKSGVTPSVATSFLETLEANELLKLKIHGSCPGELLDVVKKLEEATGSVAVDLIGRSVILYRPSLSKMRKREAATLKKTKDYQNFMTQKKLQAPRASGEGRHQVHHS